MLALPPLTGSGLAKGIYPMKTIYLIIILLLTFALFLPSVPAQDYNKWGLPEGAIMRFGKGNINGVTFSTDGNRIVVASSIGIWVYEAHTGKELDLLTGNIDSGESVIFSNDGHLLAVINRGHETVSSWDVSTGQHLKTFIGHTSWIKSVCFSPDGNTLAGGGGDGTTFLWDTATGQLRDILVKHTDQVTSICFSPDGNTLATGGYSEDNTVRLWDSNTGQHLKTITGHTKGVTSLCFSPDGHVLATGGGAFDATVQLWSTSTGQHLRTLTGHKNSIASMCFSPDGTILAGRSYDSKVYLWDAATGELQNTLIVHTGGTTNVCFSPDGTMLITGNSLWSTNTGQLLKTFTGHAGTGNSVCFSPNGDTLAIGGIGSNVRLWNTITHHLQNTSIKDSDVCFLPDSNILASGARIVHLWDAATGQHLNTLTADIPFGWYVRSTSFSPDGTIFANGIYDGGTRRDLYDDSDYQYISVLLRSTSTGRILKTIAYTTDSSDSWVGSVCFSPDGKTLASGCSDGNVRLWNVATGAHKATFKGHEGPIWSITFSPDGTTLASGSTDKTVRLWNSATEQHLKTLSGYTHVVKSICFSPDSNTLAGGDGDGIILLWNAATGHLEETLSGHTSGVESLSFSPDGNTLASGSSDGTILLWSTNMFSAQPQPEPPLSEEPVSTELTPQQIAKKALAATVLIVVEDKNGLPLGSGSGFFISREMLATNLHVVKTGHKATFKRVGKNKWYNVKKVIEKNTQQDLAILKVPDVGATVLSLGNSDAVEVGEPVYAIGNPKGLEGTFSPGFISSIRGKDLNRRIQITALISSGSSGGPVLNNEGEVIGVVVGAITEGQNLNFAIPSNYLSKLLLKVRTRQ